MSFSGRLEAARDGEGLQSTLGMLRRHWLLVVGVIAACVAVALVHHETAAKSYGATASVTFQSGTLSESALQVGAAGSAEPQRQADTEALIAHSPEVARGVAHELSIPNSPSELLGQVKVEVAPNADVLEITATSASPTGASSLANAFAKQYIAFRTASQLAGVVKSQSALQKQIAALPLDSPERSTLQASFERLTSLRAVAGSGASIIGAATPSLTPTGTGLKTSVIFGVIIGLAIAFALVFVLEQLDRRLKSIEELEREYRLPALAVIPQAGSLLQRIDQSGEALEPYRILRSALDLAGETRLMEALLITSAVSGEGKTTVAVNLAHAIALTGRKVALVELDLRRPSFASHFRIASKVGFSSLFSGTEELSDAILTPVPELSNLTVLPAGRIPPNPSEMLGSERAAEILFDLSRANDIVIVDAPPLNPVADAQVLLASPAIQAVLMVARADAVTRDQVERARSILDFHSVKPIGLVATGVRDFNRYGYEAYGEEGAPAGSLAPSLNGEGASRRSGGLTQSSLTN